jgi:hypothetical protein
VLLGSFQKMLSRQSVALRNTDKFIVQEFVVFVFGFVLNFVRHAVPLA